MMNFDELLESRRSIRVYEPEKITKEEVMQLVHAANLAPSWKNFQSARYYAVLSDEKIAEIAEKGLPSFNAKNTINAAYIVVTFVKGLSGFDLEGKPDNELEDCWGCYDAGLQTENLVLKAKEMGLGTLIMGIRNADAIREILDIPENETILSVVSVGHPGQDPKKRPRKEDEEIVKFF